MHSAPGGTTAPGHRPALTGEDGRPRPGGPGEVAADDAARWEAVAQVRRDRPGWVVIWSALSGELQARPLLRAPRGTVAAGTTPDQITAQMDAIRQAAPRPRHIASA
jgi:hypothetical protein